MKQKIMTFMSKNYGRTGLLIKKYSPEILMASGVVGMIGSTVLACKATLRVDEILEEANDNMAKIALVEETSIESYTENDAKKDRVIVRVQTGVKILKLYAPALTLGTASIACVLGAHSIMKKRNVALMVAYKTLEEGFARYRKRVIEDHGEDTDYAYRHGLKKEQIEVEEVGENGKTKKIKKDVMKATDATGHSIYARFFDSSCKQWEKTPAYNLMFLRSQQNYFNDMLKVRGHVFLNEVYDALGMERSSAGALVGWVAGSQGSDNYIDFGLYDEGSKRFINELEPTVLLDFNVDGIIYNLI